LKYKHLKEAVCGDDIIFCLIVAGVTIHCTGPHWARTEPEMTDYFNSTTVTSRIKA